MAPTDPPGGAPRPKLFDDETAPPAPDRSRFRWLAVVLIAVGALVGGLVGWWYVNRDTQDSATTTQPPDTGETLPEMVTLPPGVDPTAPATSTTAVVETSTSVVDTTTTVAPATTAPASSVPPTASAAPSTNPVGLVVGTQASPGSWNSAERWAALLGTGQAEAAVSSPAALYTRWFKLAVGPADLVEATDPGFRLTFINGDTVELTELSAAGGKVADLVECPGGTVANACQRVSEHVDLASLTLAGSTPSASAQWFGRVRLRNGSWGLYALVASKPVTAVSAPYPATYDGLTLMVSGAPAGVAPGIPLTITFSDASVEEMILAT